MPVFYLTGDIRHAGKIKVVADNLDDALDKADDGDFEVFDEMHKGLAFEFCGDEEGGVEVVDEGEAL